MTRHLAVWCGAFALVAGAPAAAHWLKPEQIVRGLANDPNLRDTAGVVRVRQDPNLPRLLRIEVDRTRWETVAAADRTRVAEEWWDTWRHNVPSGVVAVLDTVTQRSLVNFDAHGRAQLVDDAVDPTPAALR